MIIGSEIIFRENLSSTNSFAASLVREESVREGTIIRTNFQTAGRGQLKNTWESEDGMNLLISLILFPDMINPSDQFIISKIISLGITDFLDRYTANISIKWPNDIYVNNDKIAGILIETSIIRDEIENVIAGIGLNINQRIFIGSAPNPISLANATGRTYNLDKCLKELLVCIDKRYKQLLQDNRGIIDNDYLGKLYRFGTWSQYRDSGGSFEGRINSISVTGQLQIADRKGRICSYGFKEVDFL
jgi:BirA family biotin operon repressor/biotin-[acetyl-CoA-carboxylase] ligase